MGSHVDPKDRRRRIYDPPTQEQIELFTQTMPLVPHLGAMFGWWRARRAGIQKEDMKQAGFLGLWHAVLRYSPKGKLKFATIARHAILWAMQDVIEQARFNKRVKQRALIDHSNFRPLPLEEDDSWDDY